MADLVIFGCHGQLLRTMAAHAGVHFEGISTVARRLRLPQRLKRRVLQLDAAYHLVRHITQQSADQLVAELHKELGDHELRRQCNRME